MKIAIPCKFPDFKSPLEDCYDLSKWFLIYDPKKKNSYFFESIGNPVGRNAGTEVNIELLKIGVTVFIVREIGPRAKQIIDESNATVIENQFETLEEFLVDYVEDPIIDTLMSLPQAQLFPIPV